MSAHQSRARNPRSDSRPQGAADAGAACGGPRSNLAGPRRSARLARPDSAVSMPSADIVSETTDKHNCSAGRGAKHREEPGPVDAPSGNGPPSKQSRQRPQSGARRSTSRQKNVHTQRGRRPRVPRAAVAKTHDNESINEQSPHVVIIDPNSPQSANSNEPRGSNQGPVEEVEEDMLHCEPDTACCPSKKSGIDVLTSASLQDLDTSTRLSVIRCTSPPAAAASNQSTVASVDCSSGPLASGNARKRRLARRHPVATPDSAARQRKRGANVSDEQMTPRQRTRAVTRTQASIRKRRPPQTGAAEDTRTGSAQRSISLTDAGSRGGGSRSEPVVESLTDDNVLPHLPTQTPTAVVEPTELMQEPPDDIEKFPVLLGQTKTRTPKRELAKRHMSKVTKEKPGAKLERALKMLESSLNETSKDGGHQGSPKLRGSETPSTPEANPCHQKLLSPLSTSDPLSAAPATPGRGDPLTLLSSQLTAAPPSDPELFEFKTPERSRPSLEKKAYAENLGDDIKPKEEGGSRNVTCDELRNTRSAFPILQILSYEGVTLLLEPSAEGCEVGTAGPGEKLSEAWKTHLELGRQLPLPAEIGRLIRLFEGLEHVLVARRSRGLPLLFAFEPPTGKFIALRKQVERLVKQSFHIGELRQICWIAPHLVSLSWCQGPTGDACERSAREVDWDLQVVQVTLRGSKRLQDGRVDGVVISRHLSQAEIDVRVNAFRAACLRWVALRHDEFLAALDPPLQPIPLYCLKQWHPEFDVEIDSIPLPQVSLPPRPGGSARSRITPATSRTPLRGCGSPDTMFATPPRSAATPPRSATPLRFATPVRYNVTGTTPPRSNTSPTPSEHTPTQARSYSSSVAPKPTTPDSQPRRAGAESLTPGRRWLQDAARHNRSIAQMHSYLERDVQEINKEAEVLADAMAALDVLAMIFIRFNRIPLAQLDGLAKQIVPTVEAQRPGFDEVRGRSAILRLVDETRGLFTITTSRCSSAGLLVQFHRGANLNRERLRLAQTLKQTQSRCEVQQRQLLQDYQAGNYDISSTERPITRSSLSPTD